MRASKPKITADASLPGTQYFGMVEFVMLLSESIVCIRLLCNNLWGFFQVFSLSIVKLGVGDEDTSFEKERLWHEIGL